MRKSVIELQMKEGDLDLIRLLVSLITVVGLTACDQPTQNLEKPQVENRVSEYDINDDRHNWGMMKRSDEQSIQLCEDSDIQDKNCCPKTMVIPDAWLETSQEVDFGVWHYQSVITNCHQMGQVSLPDGIWTYRIYPVGHGTLSRGAERRYFMCYDCPYFPEQYSEPLEWRRDSDSE